MISRRAILFGAGATAVWAAGPAQACTMIIGFTPAEQLDIDRDAQAAHWREADAVYLVRVSRRLRLDTSGAERIELTAVARLKGERLRFPFVHRAALTNGCGTEGYVRAPEAGRVLVAHFERSAAGWRVSQFLSPEENVDPLLGDRIRAAAGLGRSAAIQSPPGMPR